MSSPARRSPDHLLVADDNEGMVQLLRDNLTDAGYEVTVATSGRQLIELLRARPVDLVLTDLRMEASDGLDVLDAVRATDEEIPVLTMSAFGAVDSAVEAIKRGAYHHLAKPFALDEVRVYIQRALGERRLRAENRAMRTALRDRPRLAVGRGEDLVIRGETDAVRGDGPGAAAPSPDSSPVAFAQQRLIPLRQLETEYIAWVLARCGGNKTRAAEILGIDVSTIHRRRDKLA